RSSWLFPPWAGRSLTPRPGAAKQQDAIMPRGGRSRAGLRFGRVWWQVATGTSGQAETAALGRASLLSPLASFSRLGRSSASRRAEFRLSPMLIALGAMFVQQTFASVGKTLPAVIAPLVIAELHADPAWVGVYYGLSAAASLFAQMGCGSFIIRYGALRMSQVALVLLGGGMAAAAGGGLLGFG